MKYKYQNLWINPPIPGDLVEIGYDTRAEKPFIGVVTEVRNSVFPDRESRQMFGCVLVNGNAKWCDLYDLKPVKKAKGMKVENAS